jgi:hypothetical protein
MNGQGGEITLALAIFAGTLIPATLLAAAITPSTLAEYIVLYGAALGAGGVIWRFVRRVAEALNVIFGLDHRVGRIETHLGLGEPQGDEA